MVTLAFGIVVEKLVSEWTEVFGGAEGIYGIKSLAILGTPFGMLQWVWFGIALGAVTHLLLRNLLSGRFGRAFLSLQADEIAAESVGVSVYRYKILAFVIAAVTCGLAGAIVAQQNQYLNSDFISFNLSIFILLLVLFGGSGNQYGPLVGAILLTLIDALLARWPSIQHLLYGALLLFSLYLMPNGVAGLIKQLLGGRGHADSARSKSKSVVAANFEAVSELAASVARRRYGFEAFRRRSPGPGCFVPAAMGTRPCPDRPEWRRQEHHDQHDHGRPDAHRGTNNLRRPGHRRRGKSRDLPPGDRTNFPEPEAFRGSVGAGKRAARTALPDEERFLGVAPRIAFVKKRGGRGTRPSMGDPRRCWLDRARNIRRPAACPTACSAGSNWQGRSPPNQSFSCSTSRRPA